MFDQAVRKIRQHLIRRITEDRHDDIAPGIAGNRNRVGIPRCTDILTQGRPTHIADGVFVFRQHDPPGIAKCPLVVLVQQKARDIAQIEPPEPADAGVRLKPITQGTLLIVEVEFLDQRPI